ncbi:MAG TPA: CAP domain-containing protein [Thermoanaerobaculia bacterium]|jgi:hypothetical protein
MRRLIVIAVVALSALMVRGDVNDIRYSIRQQIVTFINRDRAIYGLPPVLLDDAVSALGDEYCRVQIRNRTTGHFTLDGLPPYMRYSFAGVNDAVSENAAAWSATYGFNDRALYEMARRTEDAMMSETPPHDGHKRTILDPHATHVGIGIAWERGELRIVHEFLRRYVDWTKPLPRHAQLGRAVSASGRAKRGVRIDSITVHYEPLPRPMLASVANLIDSYSLPNRRREYLPRLKSEYTRRADGTLEIIRREYSDGRRGDFPLSDDGAFSFEVPFPDGPGVYTVVVWVRPNGSQTPFAASNVSIRVDAPPSGANALGGTR